MRALVLNRRDGGRGSIVRSIEEVFLISRFKIIVVALLILFFTANPPTQASELKKGLDQLTELFKEYYPRARIERGADSLEVSYKCKKSISVYTQKEELMPEPGGLHCRISLHPGGYEGEERLNAEVNQFYYEKLTLAPYSKSADKHLLARLDFSANTPTDFKNRYKSIIQGIFPEVEETAAEKSSGKPNQSETEAELTTGIEGGDASDSKKVYSGRKFDTGDLFMWKATRGDDVVYLLGTIHVAKKDFHPMPQGILKAFKESNHLLVEVDVTDPDSIKKMKEAEKGIEEKYKPPERLRDKLKPDTKKVFDEYLAWSGETWEMYDSFRPWKCIEALGGAIPRRGDITKFSGRFGIDLFLLKEAKENEIPVTGLESPDRGKLFALLPDDVSEARLKSLLLDLKNLAGDIQEVFLVWRAGDLKGMEELDRRKEREIPLLKKFHKVLLDDRNLIMVDKLMEVLPKQEGPHFVAVGSAHMYGPTGLPAQLEKRGFKVVQMEDSLPSFAGLDTATINDDFKPSPGPLLERRLQLYKTIQASKSKGIGIAGYMNSFNWLETRVKAGAGRDEVKAGVRKIEIALGEQYQPFIQYTITPYCLKLEKLLTEKLKGRSELKEGVTLHCTVGDDGKISKVFVSKKDKSKPEAKKLARDMVLAMSPFPAPPEGRLKLRLEASSDPDKVEAYVDGFVDYKRIMEDLQNRIKQHWHPPRLNNTKHAIVMFRLFRDGHIEKLRLVRSTGVREHDESCLQAVSGSSPLARLPDGSPRCVDILFTFSYNVHRSRY